MKFNAAMFLGAVSGLTLINSQAIAKPVVNEDTCDMQRYKIYPLRTEQCKIRTDEEIHPYTS